MNALIRQRAPRHGPPLTNSAAARRWGALTPTCRATARREGSVPPDDGPAARDDQQPQQQNRQQPGQPAWWNSDGLQLIPPRRRPNQHNSLPEDDWRAVRARLVSMERSGSFGAPPSSNRTPGSRGASQQPGAQPFSPAAWAHELAGAEVGCVLVSRQQGMDFFDGTVVLIAAHDDTQGSIGFVLNRSSGLRLSEVAASTGSAVSGVADVFGSQRLRVGGPVHLETLTVLHGYGGCQGAQKIMEGVYYGGLPAAASMVRSGLASPSDFRLLLGLAGWAPGQLASEISAGVWYCVSASRSVILPPEGTAASSPEAMRRQILGLIGPSPFGQRAPR